MGVNQDVEFGLGKLRTSGHPRDGVGEAVWYRTPDFPEVD